MKNTNEAEWVKIMSDNKKILFVDFAKNKEVKDESFNNFSFNHSNPIKTKLVKFLHSELCNKKETYCSSFNPDDLF